MEQHQRTVRLIGIEAQEKLRRAKVIVFGIGGVGGFAAEALVRAGVGTLAFVDGDCVDITNLNRQIIATHDTIGRPKAEVMRERAHRINPMANVEARHVFFDGETAGQFDFSAYDYVADAIDKVASKLLLIECAHRAGTPIISAMGAGNKLDPSRFRVADIAETNVCPLARVMRRELKKRGIEHTKVVFSDEFPRETLDGERAPGSISFVPSAAGLVLAGTIVRDLIGGC
ncbi:MAG: tRNA threonylcarbamoyladenosine dehydratase [Clostridiales bacterium]|jgi:tRNA A37 threonylcarbamoyladenosine dehydratase|nr:tRNA threonylcarbamoyladenosine dehydratase [Clostridiales bacterium]OQA70329.1 MAG: tRNA threonylcarbamoyladenosine dehydratase [Firmicutes bacterium ADurb.Bin248]